MTYQEIIENLSNNILVHFDQVYHSAEIVSLKKEKYPAITIGDEWIKLAPTDQRETIYIRRNGDDEAQNGFRLSSCVTSYQMRSPLRIVYFKDHAEKHNEILSHLMRSVSIGGTKLNRIIQDKWKLQKEESSGNYNFGPTAAYFAIDIYVFWEPTDYNCEEEDYCIDIINPLKKELCLNNS